MTEQAQQGQPAAQNSESSTVDNNKTAVSSATESNDNPLLSSVKSDYAELVKAKGWRSADDVITSYSNMEKFAGKFSTRGVVIPDGDDPEEWGKVYSKLGRPEAANGYEFSHIDVKTMDEAEKANVQFVKDIAFKYGLSKKQLDGFVSEYDARSDAMEAAQTLEAQKTIDKQIGELKQEWGQAWDKNIAVAKVAAKKFGLTDERMDALETGVGFAPMMRVLAEIGESMSEDGFVAGQSGGSVGAKTPKQAAHELKEIQADPDYLDNKKNPNRHKVLREKARDLYAMAYPTGQAE